MRSSPFALRLTRHRAWHGGTMTATRFLRSTLQLVLLSLPITGNAQSDNRVPSLIKTCKPAVVTIGFVSSQKLPDETQLPVIGEHHSATGQTDGYVYVSGTGFLVSPDGYIVTANHVIAKLSEPILIIQSNSAIPPSQNCCCLARA
jgi:S1-C subfamily serine protease